MTNDELKHLFKQAARHQGFAPLTPEAAGRAYDEAGPVFVSEQRIKDIVDYATGKTDLVPQTYAEAVRLWGNVIISGEPHEWDNRTTSENTQWLLRRLHEEWTCPRLPELTDAERAAMNALPPDFIERIIRGERPLGKPD